MVNFADVEKSLKAAWVNRYCSSDDHHWCALLDSHLEKFGGSFLFQCNYDLKFLDLEGLPFFYRNILTVWSLFHVDYKKGIELLTAKDLFKTPTKQEKLSTKERVKLYKGQYKKAKADGYKGSSTSYAKNIGWVEKPSFTFPGFGSGLDIHKPIGKLPPA